MKDDRKKFLENINLQSTKLGKNKKIFNNSLKFINDIDDYDYNYLWTWFGVPIIQLPADIIVNQEVIFNTKPDVIIETGIARGGSLIFYASILKLIKKKFKVIGIDINLKKHNRKSIKQSIFSRYIKLIDGSSVDINTISKIKKMIKKNDKILVILDSNHSKEHVYEECKLYSTLVTKNSYLIVTDTILGFMSKKQTPTKRSDIWYKGNEPMSAVKKFLKKNKSFRIDKSLNGKLIFASSYNGYLKKIK
jgi:cephalosporin hydroxylase